MAVSDTKLRMLYLMKILLERTDEENIMSSQDLVSALRSYGMECERKSVYSDIGTLTEYGLDIVRVRGGDRPGYYIGSRDFELPEVKLLVDAVQASKFITAKKSRELIGKIEKLVSENQAKQLQREVYIFNRTKTGNETIYYNVDHIHEAISANRQIKFRYTEWNLDKQLVPKHGGSWYMVSPWALSWEDENYYLIAYDEESGKIKHYRVDKMRNTSVTDKFRLGREQFEGFDLPSYSRKTFGMYGGRDEKVTLNCKKAMIGVVLDRFGTDITIIPRDEEHFSIIVTVSVSPQFFGWVTGLGGGVLIGRPEAVVREYGHFLREILEKYPEK